MAAGAPTPVSSLYRMEVAAGSISQIEWYDDGVTSLTALARLP